VSRRVLILSPPDDVHAAAVATAVERLGGEAVCWGAAEFPAKGYVAFDPSTGGIDVRTDEGTISTGPLHSVWWRRPGPLTVGAEVTDRRVRRFCLAETESFFRGVFDALPIPVINRPSADDAARKPRQLEVAQRLGLRIPETVFTNDPRRVVEFWRRHEGKCVYKPLTAPAFRMAETRVLEEEQLDRLDALTHAPIIVQEHVPRGVDVRVTVIGDEAFAAEVTTVRPEADIDWRLDLTASWRAHELPSGIIDGLGALLRALRLEYGCVDLRRRPDGEYVFFEVNPAGQFLFVEIDAGLPVTGAMAALLLR
jgi:hypothetical protein